MTLTCANPLSNKLPNHISEAFFVAAAKYKNILSFGGDGGGGGNGGRGEISKGGAQGGRDSNGFGPRGGGDIPTDLVPGTAKSRGGGGRNPRDTGMNSFWNDLLRNNILVDSV